MTSYKDTRIFGKDELEVFLRAVDRNLTKSAAMVIIGGSAAAFHDATSTTNDIDTYEAVSDELRTAIATAAIETGLEIPVGHSVVGQYPYDFEERLERPLADLKCLDVCVLEKHDLVLSKVVRGNAHDEQQIVEMHQAQPLDFDVLVQRFHTEMTHVLGRPELLREQFLQLIALLFGELKRVSAERTLARAKQP